MTATEEIPPDAAGSLVSTAPLDRAIADLSERAQEWALLPVADKIGLLEISRANLGRCASRWVEASVAGKRIDPTSPWVGEEWVKAPTER